MGITQSRFDELSKEYLTLAISDEIPRKEILVKRFEIMAYPVTYQHYKLFIEQTGYPISAWRVNSLDEKLNHPITNISLYDAIAFCNWAGCRLPTCVEWEKAAAGPGGLEYPWGNHWNYTYCNNSDTELSSATTPVDYYPDGKSFYGLSDMAGNVWEWTSSTIVTNRITMAWWAYKNEKWREHRPPKNWRIEGYDLIGDNFSEYYIMKGGAANSNKFGLRSSFSLKVGNPKTYGDFFGFRCVKL